MIFGLVIQLIIIGIFFVMFIRGSKLFWGIGLLTVSGAVLLNTILNIFGRQEMILSLGPWFWVINGVLLAGAAIWLWGILSPYVTNALPAAEVISTQVQIATAGERRPTEIQDISERAVSMAREASAHDLQLLHDQIRFNLSPGDVLDLIFDMELAENDVVALTGDMRQTIVNLINTAVEREQTADLALAIERILTPVPPDHFPRLENLHAGTPPTILRRYLLAFYSIEDIERMVADLEIDWERLGLGSKQKKVRHLLLNLQRRNRTQELIELMQANKKARRVEESET